MILQDRSRCIFQAPTITVGVPLYVHGLFIQLVLFIFGCAGSLLPRMAFSSCSEQGLSLGVAHRPLIAMASPCGGQVLEHLD